MHRQFIADTKEEAEKQAKEFIATQDKYSQPSIWGTYEQNGKWYVTVQWFSLD